MAEATTRIDLHAGRPLSIPHIAARFFDQPLLIEPAKAHAIAWALRDRLGLQNLQEPDPAVMDAAGTGVFRNAVDPRTGYAVENGVAILPIHGTLVHRGAWIGASSGLTSYEGIAKQVDFLAEDSRVNAVLLDIDSRGGEASGIDDVANMIRELDGRRPVFAMIDGSGSSAAYWLAAAARKVFVGNTSHGGSIGVVLTHMAFERAADEAGLTVTHIHAGAEKVLGTPWRELSDSDRSKLQTKVDRTFGVFVDSIARFRDLSAEAVRATEAAVFDGPELVDNGLADGVTTGRRLLAAIQDDFEDPDPSRDPQFPSGGSRAQAQDGGNSMSDANRNGGAEKTAGKEATYTQAEVDELLAEATAGHDEAVATAGNEATTAERQRIAGILDCEEATGRDKLARHFAFSTSMSVDDARKSLEAAPVQQNGTGLSEAMRNASPGIGADDGGDGTEPDGEEAAAQFILNQAG